MYLLNWFSVFYFNNYFHHLKHPRFGFGLFGLFGNGIISNTIGKGNQSFSEKYK